MKIVKTYYIIFAGLFVLLACKNEGKIKNGITSIEKVNDSIPSNLPDSEAGTILKKAIEFSGGWQHWRDKKTLTFTKKMQFHDSLGNQIREVSQLHRYQLRPSFKAIMTWEAKGTEHQIINNGKQAWKLDNGKVMTDEQNVNSAWNSSFGSHYVISMPFKLNDPGTLLEYQGLDTLANKQVVHSIKTTYRKGAGSAGGMHTWWYYFDKDTFELAANFLDYGEGHSYTQYETFTDVGGLKLTHVRTSYKSNANRDLLYVGTIYINEDIRFNEDFEEGLFELKK